MELFETLRHRIILSVQAEGDDPFNDPQALTLMAKAVVMGGAAGLRSEGLHKLQALRNSFDLPLIGLIKSYFPDDSVCISRRWQDIQDLLSIPVDILALDGTDRLCEGLSGPGLIRKIRSSYPRQIIMADIAQAEEAFSCADAGAHCVSTTLSGYTPETLHQNSGPDIELVRHLADRLNIPVFAEGRYNTPEQAAAAVEAGAWAVITGTAVTRPRVVTAWFSQAVAEAGRKNEALPKPESGRIKDPS